jgi:hypothetical protein
LPVFQVPCRLVDGPMDGMELVATGDTVTVAGRDGDRYVYSVDAAAGTAIFSYTSQASDDPRPGETLWAVRVQ